ncbi:hypothetical protein STANM309S_04911 [Streptomyces tanashiensis]
MDIDPATGAWGPVFKFWENHGAELVAPSLQHWLVTVAGLVKYAARDAEHFDSFSTAFLNWFTETSPMPRQPIRVKGHKPHRPGAPAAYPVALASEYGRDPRAARKLPEGPLLVAVVQATGDWSLEVHPPGTLPPQQKRPGFWRRFGRS